MARISDMHVSLDGALTMLQRTVDFLDCMSHYNVGDVICMSEVVEKSGIARSALGTLLATLRVTLYVKTRNGVNGGVWLTEDSLSQPIAKVIQGTLTMPKPVTHGESVIDALVTTLLNNTEKLGTVQDVLERSVKRRERKNGQPEIRINPANRSIFDMAQTVATAEAHTNKEKPE